MEEREKGRRRSSDPKNIKFVDVKLMTHRSLPSFSFSFLSPGVLILLLGYTVAGTILFVSLEGEVEEMDGVETAASKPYPRNNDMIYNDLRTR
jgi:hypothetical protein